MKNEKWLQEILSTVKFGDGFPKTKFHYHPIYHVGVGPDTNLDYTFGKKRKIPWKNLRKLKYFSLSAPFPSDSVIFFQPSRERLIISSHKERKVLKISTSKPQLVLLEGEIAELTHQNQSEFAEHSVKLLGYGANWLMTSFCSNLDSLTDMPILDLHCLIIEPMTKFYRSHPLEKFLLSDWLKGVELRMKDHPHSEQIRKAVDKIRSSGEITLLKGKLHFDLHQGNVLRDGDQVVIIDWEVSHPGLLIIDYFDFFRRYVNKEKLEVSNFVP
ncbi:MAG: phosphotransferase, partial [Bacteriovoracaceae bacterium]